MLYYIAQLQIEQEMQNQYREIPEHGQPNPEHVQPRGALRQRMSAMLRSLATAIEPRPATPGSVPGHQS